MLTRTVPLVHALLPLRHFVDRPYMAIALVVLALGLADLIYATAPIRTWRYKVLRMVFWLLYPILVITFFSGRRARKDKDTHVMHATLIMGVGVFILIAALFF